MSFAEDQKTKVVTFVGRPLDTLKGLLAFLECASVLSRLPEIPAFQVWIVGGDSRELRSVNSIAESLPDLRKLRDGGRLLIWGRIDHSSLPEIYSRSTVVVVPSKRETFGLVPVEAMMCGCPVVAFSTTGIKDTVVRDRTGILIPPNEIMSAAAAVSLYLRSPDLSMADGHRAMRWTQEVFDQSRLYDDIVSLYHGSHAASSSFQEVPEALFLKLERRATEDAFRRIMRQDILAAEQLPGKASLNLKIKTREGDFLARRHFHTPCAPSALLPIPRELRVERTPEDAINKIDLFSRCSLTPQLLASSSTEAVTIQEWPSSGQFVETLSRPSILRASEAFRLKGAEFADSSLFTDISSLTETISRAPTLANIFALDYLVARLQKRLSGGRERFHFFHPQVELMRLRIAVNQGFCLLPNNLLETAIAAINVLLASRHTSRIYPVLVHGHPRPRTIFHVGKRLMSIDVKSSCFAVGNLDLARWLLDRLGEGGESASAILQELADCGEPAEEAYLVYCWLTALVVFESIHLFSRGIVSSPGRTRDLLHEVMMHCASNPDFSPDP